MSSLRLQGRPRRGRQGGARALSRKLNLIADNIRNIRSADHVYPSNVHMDGVIFDSGKLRVDGQANFLAEPSAAIDADITLDQVQLDYFKPMLARMNLWITDGALWADGHVEYAPQVENFHLKNLTLRAVQLDYVHSAQTAAVRWPPRLRFRDARPTPKPARGRSSLA